MCKLNIPFVHHIKCSGLIKVFKSCDGHSLNIFLFATDAAFDAAGAAKI